MTKDDQAPELYRRYRPKKLSELVGQPEASRTLAGLGKANKIPHCLLLSGGSGTGKTTAARILANKLGCGEHDLQEVNIANTTGIDGIRQIERRMGLGAISGSCRVWILDEMQAATRQAQSCLLKMLEDTPEHVYFFLATTNPEKLLPTIRTRSTEIKFANISRDDLGKLCDRVSESEKFELTEDVRDKIADYADGSARKALVLLHAAMEAGDEKQQLDAIAKGDHRAEAIELCRALISAKGSWASCAAILKKLNGDSEAVRRQVLGYARKIMLSGGKGASRAYLVIDAFRDNTYDSGRAGLDAACWEVFHAKD